MRPSIYLAVAAGLALGAVSGLAAAEDATPAPAESAPPAASATLGSDTFVVVVSDTTFGPTSDDADVAARYYCANRGKVSSFVGKDRPLEFRSQVFQQWSLLTYHCVVPGSASN